MSFWVTFLAPICAGGHILRRRRPADWGLDFLPATLGAWAAVAGPGMAVGRITLGVSIAIFCVASLLGAINFIATILDLRTRGMTFMNCR